MENGVENIHADVKSISRRLLVGFRTKLSNVALRLLTFPTIFPSKLFKIAGLDRRWSHCPLKQFLLRHDPFLAGQI